MVRIGDPLHLLAHTRNDNWAHCASGRFLDHVFDLRPHLSGTSGRLYLVLADLSRTLRRIGAMIAFCLPDLRSARRPAGACQRTPRALHRRSLPKAIWPRTAR